MDSLEFISSLFSSTAWPLAAIVISYIFKKPIISLLALITKISYKDFTAEFGKSVERLTEEAATDINLERLPKNDNENLIKLAKISPRTAVLDSWIKLEQVASEKLKEFAVDLDGRQKQNNVHYLLHKADLPDKTQNIVTQLRYLRNKAAHHSDDEISYETALKYAQLSEQIIIQIKAISSLPKVKLVYLTSMILSLSHLIDCKKYEDISIKDIHEHIENRTILEFLKTKCGKDFFLESFFSDQNFKDFYTNCLERIYNAYAGNERRKWGIENSGLCLLLSWTNEIIQQGHSWQSNEQ